MKIIKMCNKKATAGGYGNINESYFAILSDFPRIMRFNFNEKWNKNDGKKNNMCFLIRELILYLVMLDFLSDLVSFTYRPHSAIRGSVKRKAQIWDNVSLYK